MSGSGRSCTELMHFGGQLTYLIVEKEKKSSSYKENKLEALSDEKVSKIKRFSREYITKLVRKLEKAGGSRKVGSKPSASRRGQGHHATHTHTHTPSTSAATPSSAHEDAQLDVVEMEMSVEEVVDVGDDSMDDDDDGGGGGGDDGHPHQKNDITKFQPFLNYTCFYA